MIIKFISYPLNIFYLPFPQLPPLNPSLINTLTQSMSRPYNESQHIMRTHLWNALEPGDPYDITKSLIATMPGHKKLFMGDNVEMVAFLQAAEIERLIEYLDEYRIKYKEVERQQLDRHSYEVQIKELAERCAESEGLRLEVGKLREYIRRLKEEMEDRKNVIEDENLKGKYQNALQQLEYTQKESKELAAKVSSLGLDIQHWKNRCEASEKSKERQIEELRSSIETQRRTQISSDQKEQEMQRKFSIERNQLETEIRRLKEEISVRKMEASEYQTRLSESTREAQYGRVELQSKCKGLEAMIEKYVEEIDGLKYSFRTINNEKNEILEKYKSYDEEIWKKELELGEYRSIVQSDEQIISQLNHKLLQLEGKTSELFEMERVREDYENKIVLLSQEITRLNGYSELKTTEAQNLINKYSRLEYQISSLRNQNSTLVSRISQKDSATKTIQQYKQSIFILTSDNKRLNDEILFERQNKGSVERIREENNQLRVVVQRLESEILSTQEFRKSSEIEIERFTQREHSHVRKIEELEKKFRELQVLKGDPQLDINEFQVKVLGVTEESTRLKRSYEQQIILLNQENGNMKMELDNLRRRLNNAPGGKNEGLDREIGILNDQIREWGARQRDWVAEKEELMRIIEDNQRRSRVPVEYDQRYREYEERIQNLTSELLVLREEGGYKSNDMVRLEHRVKEENEEIRRLKEKLRMKNEEMVGMQAGNEELVYLRGQIQELMMAKQNLEGNLIRVTSEINLANGQLVDEHERLKLRYQESLSKLNMYEQRTGSSARETEILANENANLNNTIQRLVLEINEHRARDFQQGTEIDRTRVIRQQNESYILTINEMNQRVRALIEQNNGYRRKINEFPMLMEVEVKNHNSLYEQRLVNAEQRYQVEQQRLHSTQQEMEELRRRLIEFSHANQRGVIIEKKVIEYQQRINVLVVENDQLRRNYEMDKSQNQRVSAELNQYRLKLPQLQNENNALRKQILEITQRVEIEMSNKGHYQNQMKVLVEENNRFKLMGGQQRLLEYESQIGFLKQEVERLKKSESELVAHFNESNLKTMELTHEIERMNVFLRQSKSSELSMQHLTQEIERLNNVLRVKVNESVEWHNKFVALESETVAFRQEYQVVESQSMTYKQRIQDYEFKFDNLNGQFQKLSIIINQLKNQNRALKQENDALHNNKDSEEKNKVLSMEIERLVALKDQLEQEILELRMRFVDQNALEKRIKQQLSLLVILFAEIESLRRRVKDKEKEVEQVRRSSLAPFMS